MKEMKPVQVGCKGGFVFMEQPDPLGNGDSTIYLTPEQIPLVCKWLRESAATSEGR